MPAIVHEIPWCHACCTQHELSDTCPGPLEATGPEHPGRRFTVHLADRSEVYQVLVAPADAQWRARIVTLPNLLWSVPGAGAVAKFVGTSVDDAERRAVMFIFRHCKTLGTPPLELAPPEPQPDDDTRVGRRNGGKRLGHSQPVLFGQHRATRPAHVTNLSSYGMFLATERPLDVGDSILILLRCQPFNIPLVGVVAWVNPRTMGGVLAGMGIELDEPPLVYRQLVDRLDSGVGSVD